MGIFILKMKLKKNYEEPSPALLESEKNRYFNTKAAHNKMLLFEFFSCRRYLDAALVGAVTPSLRTCKIHNAQTGGGPKQ